MLARSERVPSLPLLGRWKMTGSRKTNPRQRFLLSEKMLRRKMSELISLRERVAQAELNLPIRIDGDNGGTGSQGRHKSQHSSRR
jgi:hypothetical protein